LRIIFPHPEPADETLSIVIRVSSVGECLSYVEPFIAHHCHLVLPSLPSVPILELNCFIQGDDATHIFPVKIARTDSVGTLKRAIKEEKQVALEHVDADALKLWTVSVAVDDRFKENVKKEELRVEEELSPVDPLSDVFKETPAQKHVHIIVCSPNADDCEWQSIPMLPLPTDSRTAASG
jgi:hypothetical protein